MEQKSLKKKSAFSRLLLDYPRGELGDLSVLF